MPDVPAPVLPADSRASVVAEKLEAMVVLGVANRRMKDAYDVWVLSRQFEFEGPLLCQAITADPPHPWARFFDFATSGDGLSLSVC